MLELSLMEVVDSKNLNNNSYNNMNINQEIKINIKLDMEEERGTIVNLQN
jgi:hypothetical protein